VVGEEELGIARKQELEKVQLSAQCSEEGRENDR